MGALVRGRGGGHEHSDVGSTSKTDTWREKDCQRWERHWLLGSVAAHPPTPLQRALLWGRTSARPRHVLFISPVLENDSPDKVQFSTAMTFLSVIAPRRGLAQL